MLLLIEQRKLATPGLQHKPEPCCNQVYWVLIVQAHFKPLKCMRKDSHAPLGVQGTLQDSVPGCVPVSVTEDQWELPGDLSDGELRPT